MRKALTKQAPSKPRSKPPIPPVQELQPMDPFSMNTMLLRLAVTLRRGDISMDKRSGLGDCSSTRGLVLESPGESDRINFSTLDAFNAILTLDRSVVATCYESGGQEVLNIDPSQSDSDAILLPLHIIAFANPDLKTNAKPHEANSNIHNVRLVTSGSDYWPKIGASDPLDINPVGYLCSSNTMDLGSHAKTVCAYLNDYRLGDQSARENYSAKFWNYLFSISWKKMYRRMASWSGRGFIDALDKGWENVQVNTYPKWREIKLGSGDESLTAMIRNLNVHDLMFWLQVAYPEGAAQGPFLGTLLQSINSGQILFCRRTAADYHKLVLATFIMVGSSLEIVDGACRTWNGLNKQTREAKAASKRLRNFAFLAQWFTRLLLSILASASFREYILFMTHAGTSHLIPRSSSEALYTAEWERRVLSVACTNDDFGDDSDNDESSNNDWTDATVPDNLNDLDRDSGNHEVASDDDLDTGLTEVPDVNAGSEALLQWIRTFVLPFLGKRMLENTCESLGAKHPDSEVRISVLAADRIRFVVPPWEQFVPYIERALEGCLAVNGCPVPDVNEVITVIRTELKKGKRYNSARNIPACFKDLLFPSNESDQRTLTMTLGIHCEAALASLALYYHEAITDQNDTALINTCKKLYKPMIAVSKLCCPVCCELLEVLRTNDPSDTSLQFAVRGFHFHVYTVVLPPWIRPQQKQQMVSKFQRYLGSELVAMVSELKTKCSPNLSANPEDAPKMHRRSGSSDMSQASSNISQESSSVLSVASTTQDTKPSFFQKITNVTIGYRKRGMISRGK